MDRTFAEALDDLVADWIKDPGASTDELVEALEGKIAALKAADRRAEGK